MGCTTNGFILTDNKDAFAIWGVVYKALVDEMMRHSGARNQVDLWHRMEEKYTSPSCELPSVNGLMNVTFRFNGGDRLLSIFFTCDNDYNDYKEGKKIITSLGAYGDSVHLTEVILAALSVFGPAHIVDNDCESEWRELAAALVN